MPFRATVVPRGFKHTIEAGPAPSEPDAEGHHYGFNKLFHLQGSKPDRQIEIFRGQQLWWPPNDLLRIEVLGHPAWLGRSVGVYTVDFMMEGFADPCDVYTIAGAGVSRRDLKRFAERLEPLKRG